ncbi:MAG TPA: adenylate/guanylate cyclase domain-containing protein [Pseudolabrys sp.]|jgi:class 3 adenylate cyclase
MPPDRRSLIVRRRPAKQWPPIPSVVGPEDNCPNKTGVEKEPRRRNRELFALLEISQTATKSLEAEKILNATLNKSMEILKFDVGYVRTLDKERKNLVVRVARGLSSPEFLNTSFAIDSPEPIVGKTVFKTQKPHISIDVRKDQTFKSRTMEREGLVSLAMVPIVTKEDVFGFIGLGTKQSHHFSEVELRLISGFCSQLGTALANAQLFDGVQARAAELEQRMREQLAVAERLERLKGFFSPHLVERILVGGPYDPLKSHRREITAAFMGLKGFTAFAACSEPEEVMIVLEQFHREMGRLILNYDGTLARFAGEGMLVFFNDLVEVANPAERALRMAFAMRERVKDLSEKWSRLGYDLGFGVGIAHGHATLGRIGYEGRIDYGAIGTVTDVAFRLYDEANHNQILASPRVAWMLEEVVQSELTATLTLKGFPEPIKAHTILRLKD